MTVDLPYGSTVDLDIENSTINSTGTLNVAAFGQNVDTNQVTELARINGDAIGVKLTLTLNLGQSGTPATNLAVGQTIRVQTNIDSGSNNLGAILQPNAKKPDELLIRLIERLTA